MITNLGEIANRQGNDKNQLMKATNISKSTMDKMGRGEQVSMEIIDRLCNYFECKVENVIQHCCDKEDR